MDPAAPTCVLVTGGAGYIGSHAALELLRSGHRVIIVDTLERGSRETVKRLEGHGNLTFIQGNCGDRDLLDTILPDVDCIMHFAAYAIVGESVEFPDRYKRNNVEVTRSLLDAAIAAGVGKFILSSTCAIYGSPTADQMPVNEDCPFDPQSPYGQSKIDGEAMLSEATEGHSLASGALRFFNVIGADDSGILPEPAPKGRLISTCMQAARGQLKTFTINGTDYETKDGTAIRDFVHVMDIVNAHILLMKKLSPGTMQIYNVGCGHGTSVREILEAVEKVTGKTVNTVEGERRPGDIPAIWADSSAIRQALDWHPQYEDIEAMVRTSWLAG